MSLGSSLADFDFKLTLLSSVPSTPSRPIKDPNDVPPATPVNLPQCRPQVRLQAENGSVNGSAGKSKHLSSLLQSIIRPTELNISHLEALGVHVIPDAALADLIPDLSFVPDFAKWDGLSQDQATLADADSKADLGSGRLGPGVAKYASLVRELAINNEAAFRAVRRIKPVPGTTQARLGNSYDFFRYLESFTDYWDDTSAPKSPSTDPMASTDKNGDEKSACPDVFETVEQPPVESVRRDGNTKEEEPVFPRTRAGDAMHPSNRVNITTAFIKLVTYDFGCNVLLARMEPRLYLKAPIVNTGDAKSPLHPTHRHSYFTSGCSFIFRSPISREDARHGILQGPVAAVSPRHIVSFPPPPSDPSISATDQESVIDLARELVAALVTAQHRARQGHTEKRSGEDMWWTKKARWGGGSGGPIGREAEKEDGAEIPPAPIPEVLPLFSGSYSTPAPTTTKTPSSVSRARQPTPGSTNDGQASRGQPQAKKPRKELSIYDNYRIVRPPSMHWDPKTNYQAIGRQKGVDYDDIYVMSSLIHHISILRVKVPHRLLEVLDGAPDDGQRSWGKLEVVRSKWFDFFKAEERIMAMRMVWATMSYLMRSTEPAE